MAKPIIYANPPSCEHKRGNLKIARVWQVIALARVRDWIFSKVVFAIVGLVLFGNGLSIVQTLAIVTGTMALLAFGYGINEIADQSTDLGAGKANRASDLPEWLCKVFLVLTALTTVGAVLWAKPSSLSAGLALVYLLIAWQYSCTPLRLKERGLWGIVAAAMAQWTFPIAMTYACGHGGTASPSIVCFSGLCLALGIRWEGIHQSADLAADRLTGVTTFAASGGDATRLVHLAYVVELVFNAGTWALLWNDSRVPAVAFMLWCVFFPFLMSIRGIRYGVQIMRYEMEPLGPFYFRALPVALLLQSQFSWKTIPAVITATILAGLTKLPTQQQDSA
jgi:4-hydroxybenzoate polyprenyltransferase